MYDFKQVEKMLKDYPTIKAEIKMIEIDIEEIERTIGFRGNNDDPKPSTPTYAFNSPVESEALNVRREKAINNLKAEKVERQKKIEKIENALSILSEKDEEIVRLYYFKKMSLTAISYKLDRTRSQVYRRKSNAISSMMGILNVSFKSIQKCNKNATKSI